jgi:uncharacterized membrane protein YphA (DoxX/SURF4 family)
MRNMKASTISVFLWIFQVLLAALFLFSGVMKFVMSNADLTKGSPFSASFIHFIGVMEILGAFGLILPAATRIKPALTALAAAGLVIIMIGATWTTVATMGAKLAVLPFVTGILAAFVAYGRWRLAPISASRERSVVAPAR